MQVKFINMCEHSINLFKEKNFIEIKPSGIIGRCKEEKKKIAEIDGVEIYRKEYGSLENLPKKVENVFYIVSYIYASQAKKIGRSDFLYPNDYIRDSSGKIVGCKSLAMA